MKSVADSLRDGRAGDDAAMSASERVALALELGDQDREIFRDAAGLSEEAALRELRRCHQISRVPCIFFEDDP
jgi:hypothetical protein